MPRFEEADICTHAVSWTALSVLFRRGERVTDRVSDATVRPAGRPPTERLVLSVSLAVELLRVGQRQVIINLKVCVFV